MNPVFIAAAGIAIINALRYSRATTGQFLAGVAVLAIGCGVWQISASVAHYRDKAAKVERESARRVDLEAERQAIIAARQARRTLP